MKMTRSCWDNFLGISIAFSAATICFGATLAKGPLRVHPENPRYFTDGTRMPDGSLRAIYLTGSHHWNNLQDSAKLGKPLTEQFDYEGYLRFLEKFNHNFMRMWSWEVGENDLYYEPAPWIRTGPGTASDGKPKFDLQQFNPEYFQRLAVPCGCRL
jgi:hypothetical protein